MPDLTEQDVHTPAGAGADAWTGFLAAPAHPGGSGVLVLSGSSGRIERDRCRLLARQGLTALSVQWFGGPGQPPGICEVPLETLVSATEWLRAHGARRLGVLGLSKGAEAALHLSVLRPDIDAVVALSPTWVTWANVGPGRDGRALPLRSSWTWKGEPLPFVPYDDDWTPAEPESAPVSVLGWYEQSLRTHADRVPAAAIAVERSAAALVLVAGGDDLMWPSLRFAEELAARRRAAGRPVRLVGRADAGHRPRLPGEAPAAASALFRHGGSPSADAALGAAAWPCVLDALRGPGPG
ncbi:acyl-CoA thioester hydrolase/BAAT C-terminal domain-containing protein [Streptomyces sp. ITFR-16]|uniref:acyl-CoA thioester hydrolase/BAAT C-terminal domain-containing protein n=1 Tax=Streptomyces sp. ITFR-16 TaxID=3075198 RepID=UPI002889839C|nr:acyl-CoA thioester hydrolase/BAAT C-terminal domain-containing protein [Streptomyces sp. ITFR-16]WNI21940.1 acyl-CoA thioester hydrolase/BAAT C-terminal domain-containing protein [Streptomyces sp. ITFR-16]